MEKRCNLCPRHCDADREIKVGYCGESNSVRLARAALHMWEEPCISGENGSGAVFFTGCALRCIFCQNNKIADGSIGKKVSIDGLAKTFLQLQDQNAANINLVTASHFIPQVVEALYQAKKDGLHIPIVYNCSGYESIETLKRLNGVIDIYLPDMKYYNPNLSQNFSNAPDYFHVASKAIEEMVSQVKAPVFDDNGMMRHGVIVRHLILPAHTKDSCNIIKYLYQKYGDNIYISIMNQFTPVIHQEMFMELNRKLTKREYSKVIDYALSLGVTNAFIQEGETAKESFIPSFDYEGVLEQKQ